MVWNNVLERCKKNLQVQLQEIAPWNLSDAWRRNRITTTRAARNSCHFYWYILIVRIESLRSEAESSAGKKQIVNVSIKVKFINFVVGRKWRWVSYIYMIYIYIYMYIHRIREMQLCMVIIHLRMPKPLWWLTAFVGVIYRDSKFEYAQPFICNGYSVNNLTFILKSHGSFLHPVTARKFVNLSRFGTTGNNHPFYEPITELSH